MWIDISQAPRDDTPIDLWDMYRPEWGGERLCNYYRVELSPDNVFYDPCSIGRTCIRTATHFMYVPQGPQGELK